MKNKESRTKSNLSKSVSMKDQQQEINIQAQGPTKSQINRLKKFYNTTRWLPNSAFTTFFGKPAFENYGYGNTNPVYGGLFYGNYMLSHNINPIDGDNLPQEKQVYASAMLKTIKNNKLRKPEPPRKVPDEIRNTPEELNEIKARNPIFQQRNQFPNRDIGKPNLMKAKYFNSPKGSSKSKRNELSYLFDEELDIEGILDGKKQITKKRRKMQNQQNEEVEFFKKELKKKKQKDDIKNTNPEYLKYLKEGKSSSPAKEVKPNRQTSTKEERLDQDGQIRNEGDFDAKNEEMQKMKEFYERMLNQSPYEERTNPKAEEIPPQIGTELENEDNKNQCTFCNSLLNTQAGTNRLKKKENPCLVPIPNLEYLF